MERTILILAIGFLISLATIDKREYHAPIVFEELGTILLNQGVVAMDTDDLLISVFFKAPIPRWPESKACDQVECTWHKRCKYCVLTPHCTHTSVDQHWMSEKFERLTNEYINLFNDISSNVLSTVGDAGTQQKRFAGLIGIGLGLFNLAFAGITSFKLDSKVDDMKADFKKFENLEHNLHRDLITLRENTIHLFDAYSKHVNHKLIKMACKIKSDMNVLSHYQVLNEWEDKLRKIFKYPLLGHVSGPLTPDIVSTPHLREILETHPQLSELIYNEKLANFYSTTTISIGDVSMINGSLNVHYVLHVPSVRKLSTFPLYRIRQVGIKPNQSCLLLNAPRYAYLRGDSFFEVPQADCEINEIISYCHSTTTVEHISQSLCLTRPETCTFKKVQCNPEHVYSASGILITQADKIYAILNTNEVKKYTLNQVSTAFITWENLVSLQIDTLKFQAPNYAPSHISAPPVGTQVMDLLQNISWITDLNSTFNARKYMPAFNDDNQIIDHKTSGLLSIITCILILTIAITIAIIVVCYRHKIKAIYRKLSKKGPEEVDPNGETSNTPVETEQAAGSVALPRN